MFDNTQFTGAVDVIIQDFSTNCHRNAGIASGEI